MSETIQQLALLDTLLGNWDGVKIRLGDSGAPLKAELAGIAGRLAAAASPDEIAMILDDLLDLLADTPAYDYVQGLIARAQTGAVRTREAFDFTPMRGMAQAAEVGTGVGANAAAGRGLGNAVAAQTEPYLVQVYFATNRKPGSAAEGHFTADPAETLGYGLADVTIPVGHRLGEVEQRGWWNPLSDKSDPRRYVVLGDLEHLTGDNFVTRLAAEPDAAAGLLVFLHGYNVTFEEAARRAAQFAFDIRFKGRVVLFSWPSLGSFLGYGADEERAFLSAQGLRGLLQSLEDGPWGKVHLLAHSMGNRVLLHGLAGDAWPNRKLEQILFVAADVYVETFKQQFPRIKDHGRGYTSYASQKDRALLLSSFLHKAQRLGISEGEPFVMDNLTTIDATAVDTGLLGHSYFADQRSLITDIGTLIGKGLPPSDRGLSPAPGQRYWYFPR